MNTDETKLDTVYVAHDLAEFEGICDRLVVEGAVFRGGDDDGEGIRLIFELPEAGIVSARLSYTRLSDDDWPRLTSTIGLIADHRYSAASESQIVSEESGEWMISVAELVHRPKVVEGVFRSIVADLHYELEKSGESTWRVRWIRIKYWVYFLKALLPAASLRNFFRALILGD